MGNKSKSKSKIDGRLIAISEEDFLKTTSEITENIFREKDEIGMEDI